MKVYIVAVNGTDTRISTRSPRARLTMNILGTLRMFLLRITVNIRVPLPTTPTTKMKRKTIGTTYASGRLLNRLLCITGPVLLQVALSLVDELEQSSTSAIVVGNSGEYVVAILSDARR